MNHPLKISVVTIVYNDAEGLRKTIQSVIGQEYANLEYIVIDGGSTDGTVEVIKEFSDVIKYWVSEPDEGISDAFNKGVKAATGDWVGLLNADDEYCTGTLNYVGELNSHADVLYGKMETLEKGVSTGVYVPNHERLEEDMTICHPATFIRKIAYDKYGVYRKDFRLAMDYELLLRMKVGGAMFSFCDRLFTQMTMEGVSNANWKKAFKEVQLARKVHINWNLGKALSAQAVLARKTVAHFLVQSGMSSFVQAVRRSTSKVKKESV